MWNFILERVQDRARARRSRRVTLSDARDRARRGAAFLDETVRGWADDVDALSLDLASDRACVLGRLHGSFALGLGRSGVLNVSSAPRASFSPVELGFHCIQGIGDKLQDRDYALLNQAWSEEIRLRVSPAASSVAGRSVTPNDTPDEPVLARRPAPHPCKAAMDVEPEPTT